MSGGEPRRVKRLFTIPVPCLHEGCENMGKQRGFCLTHYTTAAKHGLLGPKLCDRTMAERFWVKVDKTDECWFWIGAITSRGYGNFYRGRGEGNAPAHRVAYELLVGPIPEGLDLDHLCRVRCCVNPEHLEPVTRRENSLRGASPMIRVYHERRRQQGEAS